jgi:hypothetical protein
LKKSLLNLLVIVMWVVLALFVASELVLAARYQDVNHQILLYSFLYGVFASLVVMLASSTIAKTSNAVLKFAGLFLIVSASSTLLFVVTPYKPYISATYGTEWLYTEKMAVIVAGMYLSASVGVLNACKIRKMTIASWRKISVLADLEKMKSFVRYLRTAGTS